MKRIISIFLTILIVSLCMSGLTACTKKDTNIYVEVQHPLTGEWEGNRNGTSRTRWELPYIGEGYLLNVRYIYQDKIIDDPVKKHLVGSVNKMTETPSIIGEYILHYRPSSPSLGVNTLGFDITLDIYGELNIDGDTRVDLHPEEINSTVIHYYNNSIKHYQFTVLESGTYRFETIDRNIREKYISINGIASGTKKEDNDNEYEFEAYLEAGKTYVLWTGLEESSRSMVAPQNDYYDIKISRIG